MSSPASPFSARSGVRGIALLTVLGILTVCALLSLATMRSALLQDMMTGQQADQFRARAAAEALLRDAELDILGQAPAGGPCRPFAAGVVGCRMRGAGEAPSAAYFPQTLDDYEEVKTWLQAHDTLCSDAICLPPDLAALDDLADELADVRATGASYGRFTRPDAAQREALDDPILAAQPPRAWYWTELLRYDTGPDAMAPRAHLQPDPARPFVYRITAVALGLKAGTRAVLQSYFVPYPAGQLQ